MKQLTPSTSATCSTDLRRWKAPRSFEQLHHALLGLPIELGQRQAHLALHRGQVHAQVAALVREPDPSHRLPLPEKLDVVIAHLARGQNGPADRVHERFHRLRQWGAASSAAKALAAAEPVESLGSRRRPCPG